MNAHQFFHKNIEFSYCEHTADVEIHVSADTLTDIFEGALLVMCDYMGVPDFTSSFTVEPFTSSLSHSLEEHFVDFLNEALFISITKKAAISRVHWKSFLHTSSAGSFELCRWLQFHKEIKAVTHHNLRLFHNGRKWECFFIVDV